MGTVQQKIYEILDEKHMTQAKVARAAGISPKLFNAMLRGRKLLRPEYICPIADPSYSICTFFFPAKSKT